MAHSSENKAPCWLIVLPTDTSMQKAPALSLVLPNIIFKTLLTNNIREAGGCRQNTEASRQMTEPVPSKPSPGLSCEGTSPWTHGNRTGKHTLYETTLWPWGSQFTTYSNRKKARPSLCQCQKCVILKLVSPGLSGKTSLKQRDTDPASERSPLLG